MAEDAEKTEIAKLKAIYYGVWKNAFREFLGWSEERVERWAQRFWLMQEGESGFYHESELYYLSQWLVPARFSGTPGRGRVGFRIEDAIHSGNIGDVSEPDFDWQAAKVRVEATLNAVGASLEKLGRELDEAKIGIAEIQDGSSTPD